MTPRALFFDFDGIITDTEPIHMEAWLAVLEAYGVSFTEEDYHQNYLGFCDRDFLGAIESRFRIHFSQDQINDLINAKIATTLALLEHDIPVLPGVAEAIRELSGDYTLAIVSGANRTEIETILKHLGWLHLFKPIVAGEDVKRGKPDPEGYIRALEVVRDGREWMPPLASEECVAIEDSPKGIAAAKAAGLTCVAITNSFARGALDEADAIVDSIADIDFHELVS